MTVANMANAEAARQALTRGLLASGVSVNNMMPSNNPEVAVKSFRIATDTDPSMCDAWLARIHAGDDSVKTLASACEARATFGWEFQRLSILQSSFCPMVFDGLFVSLEITSRDSLLIAYATVLAREGRYAKADEVLSGLTPTDPFDADLHTYAQGVLYFRAKRWPDVLRFFTVDKVWRKPVYGAAAAAMASTALASLGVFEDAYRRAQAAIDTELVPHAATIALYTQGMCLRHLGKHDDSAQLLRRVYARDAKFAPAREALDDKDRRLTVTNPEAIEARSDPWDPNTEPTPETEQADQQAELLAEAEAELDRQIGLVEVKRQVHKLQATVKVNKVREERGLPLIIRSHHMAFTGPPGTGKTTIARVVANIYCGLGILPTPKVVEAKRADFVAGYLGQTAEKTDKKIDEALGGVLFIDEAYMLIQEGLSGGDAFGKEAVDTLLARMENDRHQLMVIIAGYDDEIDRFLASNEGLGSRIPRRIRFASYTPTELCEIAASMAAQKESTIDPGAIELLEQVCAKLAEHQVETTDSNGQPGKPRPVLDVAGNGRFIRNVIEESFDEQMLRIAEELDTGDVDDTTMTTITERDIAAALRTVLAPAVRGAVDLDSIIKSATDSSADDSAASV